MEIIKLEDGYLEKTDFDHNKITRLFITNDKDKPVAKSHINKQNQNFKYSNRIIYIEDLEYIVPFEVKDIILDFEPSNDVLELFKICSSNIYLWEDMDTLKISKLDNLNE